MAKVLWIDLGQKPESQPNHEHTLATPMWHRRGKAAVDEGTEVAAEEGVGGESAVDRPQPRGQKRESA